MADGPVNSKIGYIIQARMQSTRLPGKVLLPLPFDHGKPLLLCIVEALSSSKIPGTIFVASSVNQEDNVLYDFCVQEHINCFRGDEEDVHSRFVHICDTHNFDHIVRLTGDNPVVDTVYLEKAIRFHVAEQYDYTHTQGLPLGMNFEIVKTAALMDTKNQNLSVAEKEHVTLCFKHTTNYKCGVFDIACPPVLSAARMTVDYASDYLFMSALYSYAVYHELPVNLDLLHKVYRDYNWFFEATKYNLQKQQYNNEAEEIRQAIRLLNKLDMQQAAKILQCNQS